MSLLEICLLCLCAWVATASVIALVFCLRLKRDNERAAMQCKFDPMSCKGIERGDGLYRVTKETRKEIYR